MLYTSFHQITLPPGDRARYRAYFRGFLRYILVKVVEPKHTGRSKRTFKLSKPDMDVVTGFMKTVRSQIYGEEMGILTKGRFQDFW